MIKKPINQNDSFDLELLNSIESNYVFENNPINRLNNKNTVSKTSFEEKIKEVKSKIL